MVQKPGSTQRPKPDLTASTNTGISKIIYSTSDLLGYNWAAFTLGLGENPAFIVG